MGSDDGFVSFWSRSNFEDAFGSPAVGKPQAALSGGGAKRARALFEYEATADTELGDSFALLKTCQPQSCQPQFCPRPSPPPPRFALSLSLKPSALEGLPTTIPGETRFLACFYREGRAVKPLIEGHSAVSFRWSPFKCHTHCACTSHVLTLCSLACIFPAIFQISRRGKSLQSCVKTTADGGRVNTTERSGGSPTTTSRYSDSIRFDFKLALRFGSIRVGASRRLFPLSPPANKSRARSAIWPRPGPAGDSLPRQGPLFRMVGGCQRPGPAGGSLPRQGPLFPCLPLCLSSPASVWWGLESFNPVVCLTNKCLQRALVMGDRALGMSMRARERQLINRNCRVGPARKRSQWTNFQRRLFLACLGPWHLQPHHESFGGNV
jgi:hypothetical protein